MTVEAFSDGLLGWIIRIAGLFWLFGAFMLYRQIRMEMMLDRMTSRIETMTRDLEASSADDEDTYGDIDAPVKRRELTPEEQAIDAWTDRDDAARRGWIAAQSVVLGVTAMSMMLLHPLAAWLVALLVIGQGVYFIWREYTARHAPNAECADHARPTTSTVNAGWFSLVVAILVWAAAFRGVLH
jgi:ABC-type nickel/cobalt efflux system permease component RcnA